MTFDELKEEVFLLTNRRSFIAETESAIRAATLKAHKSDFYSKDLHEQGVEFPTVEFRQSLDYISLIPNFRSLKYLRRVETPTDDVGAFFEIVAADNVLDSYNCNRTQIAYVAGRVLEIRADVEFQFALLGAYVSPVVRVGAYDSWVAEQFPFAIIYEVCRIIFRMVGQIEESNAFGQLAAEQIAELRMSALSDVGS